MTSGTTKTRKRHHDVCCRWATYHPLLGSRILKSLLSERLAKSDILTRPILSSLSTSCAFLLLRIMALVIVLTAKV
jgi:hypothetical protein